MGGQRRRLSYKSGGALAAADAHADHAPLGLAAAAFLQQVAREPRAGHPERIDSAIGQLFVGIMLDVMHFPKGAKPESIDPHSLWNLGLVDGPLAIIPGVIAAFFYGRYAIDRRRYTETRRQLEAARIGRKATAPPPTAHPDLSQEAQVTLAT